MATGNDDNTGAVVALVSGALIGIAATFIFLRIQRNRRLRSQAADDDYCYDGGDLFV